MDLSVLTVEEKENIIKEEAAKLESVVIKEAQASVEPPPPNSLISFEALKKKKALEIKEQFKEMEKEIQDGFQIIQDVLVENKIPEMEEINQWFADHGDDFISCIQENANSEEEFILQDLVKFPDKYLNVFYEAVLFLFKKDRFEEAKKAIPVCLTFNYLIPNYWLLHGMIEQELQNHKEAIEVLSVAAEMEEENPYPLVYMANSWAELKEAEHVKSCLKKATKLAKGNDEYKEAYEYCKVLSKASV